MSSVGAGKLRHRVALQQPVQSQDGATGAVSEIWITAAEVWAAIEPLSAREFIESGARQAEVVARITIRYRSDILPTWRIVHGSKTYKIEGSLADKDSGRDYLTLPVSQGVPSDAEDAVTVISGGSAGVEPDSILSGGAA